MRPDRRRFLRGLAGVAAATVVPAFGQPSDFWSLPRELWLYRPATREQVRAVYWADGQLVLDGYVQICRLLRDVQADTAVQFDLVTLDIARGVYGWLRANGIDRPLIINSGYRTGHTNANEGGARNSFHTKAQALDLRIDGVSPEAVGRFGQYLAGGGVGFYPSKRFTHLDRGRVRTWVG
ncbi:YcbK family protein [Massilia sp. LjRoot122]|uniref:YcbK family protein n=1 Tax=Massilia sp. LjRoot122 TaxID=3342257 RepID=UPI003ED080E5